MKAPPPGLSFMDKVSMDPGDLMGCEFNAIRTCMTMAASVRPKAADRCEACGDGPSKTNEALCANWCLVKGKLLPLRTGRLNRSTSSVSGCTGCCGIQADHFLKENDEKLTLVLWSGPAGLWLGSSAQAARPQQMRCAVSAATAAAAAAAAAAAGTAGQKSHAC
jgi:hypothetical protein